VWDTRLAAHHEGSIPVQPRAAAFSGWPLLLFGLILGVSIVVGTMIVARTITYVKTFDNAQLTVTGSTEQRITSDQVTWSSNFTRTVPADGLKDGYGQMKQDLSLVLSYFQAQGVTDSEITVAPVMMNPIYNNCTANGKLPVSSGCVNSIVSYRLSQNIQVNSGNVQQITKLAQDSTSLINQGVVFSTQRLEYFYSKLAGLRVQLLAAATKDAQVRAQKIARSTGSQIGHLVSVSTGVIQITPVNSTEISNGGTYDTSTIDKQITAVVRASFVLGQ
jgi:hypothetical protein